MQLVYMHSHTWLSLMLIFVFDVFVYTQTLVNVNVSRTFICVGVFVQQARYSVCLLFLMLNGIRSFRSNMYARITK